MVVVMFTASLKLFAQYLPIRSILEVEGPPNSNIELGTGIIGLGDVNGDGNPDFAVSAWNAKKTYIYYGGKGILDGVADDSIPGGGAIEKGDLNGDGVLDLVIKLNGDTSWVDQLAIYLGRKDSAHRYDTIPNLILREEPVNGYLGNSKSGDTFAIGDLNNDGYDDLVVGAPDYYYRGKIYIYFGGNTIAGVPNYTAVGDTVCTSYALNIKIGDVNGDGIKDLLVGSDRYTKCTGFPDKITLDVYYGSTNWLFNKNHYDKHYDSDNPLFNYVSSYSIADINADGIKDIAFPSDSNKIYFIFGRRDSLSSFPDFSIKRDTNDYDSFTYVGPVINIGDINNDRKEDFVIKAYSGGEYCLHLFLGNEVLQTQRVAVRCKSGVNYAYDVVVPVGDVNGDGVNDFASVAPNNLFPPNDGYFVIFSGDSGYVVTSIEQNSYQLPQEFRLKQNYPNPFNPSTTIEYSVQESGNVVLKIYDAIGKEIKTLVNQSQVSGDYKIVWDGTDSSGEKVSSGIYFYRLQIDNTTITKKAVYIK